MTHWDGECLIFVCDGSRGTNWTQSDSLQDKSDNLVNFLDRFRQISVRRGKSIVQCCKDADIARSLFYEIRDGNRAVSDKVWAKLQAAEEAAGIYQTGSEMADRLANPYNPERELEKKDSRFSSSVNDETINYRTKTLKEPKPDSARLDAMERRMREIEDSVRVLMCAVADILTKVNGKTDA